jgi:excisionase family DNA binding protein
MAQAPTPSGRVLDLGPGFHDGVERAPAPLPPVGSGRSATCPSHTDEPIERVERVAYRPAEAADAIGVSRSRIYELMAAGLLPYRQVGSVRLIPRAALEALVAVEASHQATVVNARSEHAETLAVLHEIRDGLRELTQVLRQNPREASFTPHPLRTPNGARVRSLYSYAFVAHLLSRSRSWVAHKASAGEIARVNGRVPLNEVLRLTGLSIEEFTALHGENDGTPPAASDR